MPKSTTAVSFVALFLLGYLVGTGRADKPAAAGPSDVSGNGSVWFTTGADSDVGTVWTVKDGRVTQALHYRRNGNVRDGVEELTVRKFVPGDVPGDTPTRTPQK